MFKNINQKLNPTFDDFNMKMEKLDDNGLNKSTRILLLVGVLVISLNLRPALAAIGPLIELIGAELNLSEALLGLLTTLPLIAFGVVSTITPVFTKKFGIGNTLLGSLILLTLGILIRSANGIFPLYFGTVLLGIAIAFGNVLIPALIKRNFPHKAGLVTSLYTGVMSLGASIAAGLSFPLATEFNMGWKGSLAIWTVFSILAIIIWIPNIKRIKRTPPRRSFIIAMKKLSGSILVWKLALYMGLQSFAFYTVLAWLPSILIGKGMDANYAGWMLSLSQVTGIIGAMVIPIWAGKRKDQRLVILVLSIIEIVSLVCLMIPQIGIVELWVSLIGIVLGGTFGLALLLIVLRSDDAETAAELSGLVQSIGYFVAATGPFAVGVIYDLTHVWNYALVLLIFVGILKLTMGIGVGKDQKV